MTISHRNPPFSALTNYQTFIMLSNFQQSSYIAGPVLHSPLQGSCIPVSVMQLDHAVNETATHIRTYYIYMYKLHVQLYMFVICTHVHVRMYAQLTCGCFSDNSLMWNCIVVYTGSFKFL